MFSSLLCLVWRQRTVSFLCYFRLDVFYHYGRKQMWNGEWNLAQNALQPSWLLSNVLFWSDFQSISFLLLYFEKKSIKYKVKKSKHFKRCIKISFILFSFHYSQFSPVKSIFVYSSPHDSLQNINRTDWYLWKDILSCFGWNGIMVTK